MFRGDRKTIYVNSSPEFRDAGGTSEDFTITDTEQTITNLPKTVKLVNACIPFTWFNIYSIDQGETTVANNHFEFEDSADNPFSFDVTPGDYNGTSLAAAIQAAMNATVSPDTFTVTFSTTSFKFTFHTSNVAGMTLKLDGIANNMERPLGFDAAGPDPAKAQTIESPNVSNLLIDLEMFICSDLVCGAENGIIPWNTESPDPDLCILARVAVRSCFGAIMDYSAHPELPFYPVTQSFFSKIKEPLDTSPRTVRYYLRWPSGIPVDLNGYNWTGEIVFDFNG
jgi:hypothetical protein